MYNLNQTLKQIAEIVSHVHDNNQCVQELSDRMPGFVPGDNSKNFDVEQIIGIRNYD